MYSGTTYIHTDRRHSPIIHTLKECTRIAPPLPTDAGAPGTTRVSYCYSILHGNDILTTNPLKSESKWA